MSLEYQIYRLLGVQKSGWLQTRFWVCAWVPEKVEARSVNQRVVESVKIHPEKRKRSSNLNQGIHLAAQGVFRLLGRRIAEHDNLQSLLGKITFT